VCMPGAGVPVARCARTRSTAPRRPAGSGVPCGANCAPPGELSGNRAGCEAAMAVQGGGRFDGAGLRRKARQFSCGAAVEIGAVAFHFCPLRPDNYIH